MSWGYYGFREHVPVAQKKANALKLAASVAKEQGREPSPVKIEGRKIARTFWGQAWCDNLEAYSDFSNRLPRGATYVRNGSVTDLVIKPRCIEAIVAGSEAYTVTIKISGLPKAAWQEIKRDCSTSIDSLLDLLSGKFSDGVMQRLTRQKGGLFPSPKEIELDCSCPDYSYCCKHIAAVMYGVGARLDTQPELLFLLREVDAQELVTQAVAEGNLDKELGGDAGSLAGQDLGAIFGIELEPAPEKPSRRSRAAAATKPVRKAASSATKVATSAKKSTGKKREQTSVRVASAASDGPVASEVTTKRTRSVKAVTVKKPAKAKIAASSTSTKTLKAKVKVKQPAASGKRAPRPK